MKVLFYLYPGVLPQGPDFNGPWTSVLARLARALASTGTGEYVIVTASRFAHHAPDLPERVKLHLIDDIALHAAVREVAPRSATPTALAELARWETDDSDPAIALLTNRIRSTCGDFAPDLIVTFSMTAEYLHSIWPGTPILNVEAGGFSRAPYAFSLYFDHIGIYRSSGLTAVSSSAIGNGVRDESVSFAADFRAWARDALRRDDPFRSYDYRSKFECLALLPLQVSNWYSFDELCNYKTQFEYLYDVLSSAPKEVGVIATEYIQWGSVFETSNSASNLDFFRKNFPNLIVPPAARKYASCSQYLCDHVDGVWSVSSNVGYQAVLLGKRLGSPLRSFYRNIADDHMPAAFFENLARHVAPDDRLAALAWYFERYLVPEALFSNGVWLYRYLSERRAAILSATDPMDGFIPLDSTDAISEAWRVGRREGPAERWSSRSAQDVQRQAKTDVLLAKSENRVVVAEEFAAQQRRGDEHSYILLNDTRAIDHGLHLGCNSVTQFIHNKMSQIGLRAYGVANNADECAALLQRPGISGVKLVIFNGEGSMHHDSKRCQELMDFCAEMKRRSVRCVLVNTVWHENSELLGSRLQAFDLITVRESISLEAIRRSRDDVHLVPDISFAAFQSRWEVGDSLRERDGMRPFAVIDNVNSNIATTLSEFAEFHQLPYFLMGTLHVDRVITDNATAYEIDHTVYPRILRTPMELKQIGACLTGRFHGLAAALAAGLPALSLPSNTPKIEGLLDDIGIREYSLLPESWLEHGHIHRYAKVQEMLSNWTPEITEKVANWMDSASERIHGLFACISDLVRESSGREAGS